jgi:hypothetical protein
VTTESRAGFTPLPCHVRRVVTIITAAMKPWDDAVRTRLTTRGGVSHGEETEGRGEVSAMLWQFTQNALMAVLGAIGNHLWESRKRLQFDSTDWKFQYLKQDTEFGRNWVDRTEIELTEGNGQGSNVRYWFTFRIFNEKSKAIGLHKFSIEFMKGKGFQQERLFQHDDPLDRSVSDSPGYGLPQLSEMQLPSREWVVGQIVGYPGWRSILRQTDSVWFIAHSPSGKRFRWKIPDVTHRLGVPRS